MYAFIENQTFKRYVDIEKEYPEIAFPYPTDNSLLPEGVVYVLVRPYPECDGPDDLGYLDIQPKFDNENLIWHRSWSKFNAHLLEERDEALEKLVVTTLSNKTFLVDEASQNKMCRCIVILEDLEVMPWVLLDNSIVLVDKVELKEALRLAGEAMVDMWFTPYL